MANQILNNLKTIHNMQASGENSELLRSVRSEKIRADEIFKEANARREKLRREREESENQALKEEIKKAAIIEEKKVEVVESQITETAPPVSQPNEEAVKPQTSYRNFSEKKDFQNRNNENRPYQNQNPSYNNNQNRFGQNANQNRNQNANPNRLGQNGNNQRLGQGGNQGTNQYQNRQGGYNGGFNRNPQGGGFNNSPQGGGFNRNPQGGGFNNNPQGGGFNRGPQSGGFNRNPQGGGFNRNPQGGQGFNNQGQRPPAQSGKFVSSKTNNFRSFNDPKPSLSTLAQPERQFGNKNKTKSYADEKKQTLRKTSDYGRNNNILIQDGDGYDEERMGSRKLIKNKKKEQEIFIAPKVEKAVITTETVSVKTLSEKIGKTATEIIKQLMILGIMATINSTIDFTTAELVSSELGISLEQKVEKSFEEQLIDITSEAEDETSVKRPPIVTVMGHVDHGKTSLLDALRETDVVASEAGGITQSIGAYQISKNGEKITFIDTPGHAAFTAMRARGAKSTDIAILVVAADDGVMPQTKEAIKHIKDAGVPMIVAINKMDKPTANPDKIKQQLADCNVLPEEWGGDAICVPISAKNKTGLDDLVKTILLVAEVEELKAPVDKMASGVIIEAELDKNRGPVASVLVQSGTLRVGDNIVSGLTYGKVRAIFDGKGKPIKEATPSTPVVVLGFNEVPSSGDSVFAVDEKLSKQVIEERKNKLKLERANKTSGVTLDDFMNKVNEGKLKTYNVVIKADTQGSLEALISTLSTISNEEVKVHVVSGGTGAVSESDVVLASASESKIICFNQKPSNKAKQLAESTGVEIKEYKIIYEIVEEVTEIIDSMLTIKYEQQTIGHGVVRMVFKLSTFGLVCGTYVTDGHVIRSAFARITRGDELIGESAIESLRVGKEEKSDVNHGFECGIKLKNDLPFKEDDTVEFYINVPVTRR